MRSEFELHRYISAVELLENGIGKINNGSENKGDPILEPFTITNLILKKIFFLPDVVNLLASLIRCDVNYIEV